MSDVTPYKMAIWRYLCQRDYLETEARRREQETPAQPPMCLRRVADLEAGMDETSAAAGRIAAQFSTAKEQA